MSDEPTPGRDPYGERLGAAVRAATATVEAPHALRERLAAEAPGAARRTRRRRSGLAAGVGLLAATVVALVLALGSGPSAPALADVAVTGLQAPTGGAPADARDDPAFLDVKVGAVRFPSTAGYDDAWRPVGVREDEVDGRKAITVVYRSAAGGLHYTIVGGSALDVPSGAMDVPGSQGRLAALRADGAEVVTWERDGQTCILASREVSRASLLTFFRKDTDD